MPLPFRRLAAACASAWLVCFALAASAQSRRGPDVVDIALAWARGGFASPVVCRFAELGARRGLRRVIIAAGPRTSEQRVDRVQFVDLDAKGAERCTDELGMDEPNVVGTIYVTHMSKRPNSDTPERDFQKDVERGPIVFEVTRGRLGIGAPGGEISALRDVDFAGAKLTLAPIKPGSDDARSIADLPGTRQLKLDVEAKDGTRVALPLVEVERR